MIAKYTFITILFFTLNSFGQSNTDKVIAIKNYVENLNNDKTLTTVKCLHNEFADAITDGIETLYGYYKYGELLKIKHVQDISPATQIFKIIHFKNNKIAAYRYVTQVHEYNEETQKFNTEWKVTNDIHIYIFNGVVIELTSKGENDLSLLQLVESMNNNLLAYKNMLRKK